MHEFSLKFLKCAQCGCSLDLDIFSFNEEIEEGILRCQNCKLIFPIINKVPILWNNFSNYLSSRIILGGKLFRLANNKKMKKFVKDSLANSLRSLDDRTKHEEKWAKIYQNSMRSKFYSIIKNKLKHLPKSNLVLEYGCSIGIMANHLANFHNVVFGIDRSFTAIQFAKQNNKKNLDYFVTDSSFPIFGKKKFDLILALNILELIEPEDLLNRVNTQIKKGYFVLTDPYDFDRGKNSVKKPMNEISLRKSLNTLGFSITSKTKTPSFYPWNLKISLRTSLHYKVDLIIGKK